MAAKGTWKYRKLEHTPQVGKDAGTKKYCAIAAYRLRIKDFLFFFLLILSLFFLRMIRFFVHCRGGSKAEFTTTIKLIIEIVDMEEFVASHLQSSLSPVLFPPFHIRTVFYGNMSSHIYLSDILPAR